MDRWSWTQHGVDDEEAQSSPVQSLSLTHSALHESSIVDERDRAPNTRVLRYSVQRSTHYTHNCDIVTVLRLILLISLLHYCYNNNNNYYYYYYYYYHKTEMLILGLGLCVALTLSLWPLPWMLWPWQIARSSAMVGLYIHNAMLKFVKVHCIRAFQLPSTCRPSSSL